MENQANYTVKKRRGRKAIPPELKKKSVTAIVSPVNLEKILRDIDNGIADNICARVSQIVEEFYHGDEIEEKPPW